MRTFQVSTRLLKVLFPALREKCRLFWLEGALRFVANRTARAANRMIVATKVHHRTRSVDRVNARVYCATLSWQEVMLSERSMPGSWKVNEM